MQAKGSALKKPSQTESATFQAGDTGAPSGPEDLALDFAVVSSWTFVSCATRRDDLEAMSSAKLRMLGEPVSEDSDGRGERRFESVQDLADGARGTASTPGDLAERDRYEEWVDVDL